MLLFIDATVRKNSRTLDLANYYLSFKDDEMITIRLMDEDLHPLNEATILKRNTASQCNDFSDAMFKYAHLFRNADEIVIAAPYYDLSFPSSLKLFIENVTVNELTFGHDDQGERIGLCSANKLIYITSSGSPIVQDYGYAYMKDLCTYMYGINDVICFSCEGLDSSNANTYELINKTKQDIFNYVKG